MERRILLSGNAARSARGLLLVMLLSPSALAHLLNMTEAQLSIDSATRSATLQLHIDLLRSLGSTDAYRTLAERLDDPGYMELWQRLADGVDLMQGERRLPLTVVGARPPDPYDAEAFTDPFRWPKVQVSLLAADYDPEFPVTVTFSRRFVFEEPIALTIEAGERRLSRWLVTSQTSPSFAGSLAAAPAIVPSDDLLAGMQRLLSTFWVGFLHILPAGVDHLMFVLAVLLLCDRLGPTALLITAFTLGHSVSLAVAAFGLVSIPTALVEPLILFSICVYGLQALRASTVRLTTHYWGVAAVGLLHGLGFAAAFEQLSWGEAPLLHLLSFNIGIEIAQLVFVLCAFPLINHYRSRLLKPMALVLVIAPLLWLPRLL